MQSTFICRSTRPSALRACITNGSPTKFTLNLDLHRRCWKPWQNAATTSFPRRHTARRIPSKLRPAAISVQPTGVRADRSRRGIEIVGTPRVPRGAKIGAGEGIRTLDPDLGKVVLYPLATADSVS